MLEDFRDWTMSLLSFFLEQLPLQHGMNQSVNTPVRPGSVDLDELVYKVAASSPSLRMLNRYWHITRLSQHHNVASTRARRDRESGRTTLPTCYSLSASQRPIHKQSDRRLRTTVERLSMLRITTLLGL